MAATKTFDQGKRMDSLALANSHRSTGRSVKQVLAELPVDQAWQCAARILADDPDQIGHMEIHQFLRRIPRVGETRIRKILKTANVWPLRRVRDLTDRERRAIANLIVQNGGWPR